MFEIAQASRYRLARPPLVQAIAQVRYPLRTHLQSMEGIAPVQDRLEALFPYLKEQQMGSVSFVLTPDAPVQAGGQTSRAWRFTDDIGWILTVAPDQASITVGPQYGSFEEFATRFRAMIEALSEAAGVTRCDRLGVRYIDIAEVDPTDPGAWRGWFRPELTGWPATEVVSGTTNLVASISQTQLSAPPVGELSGPPVDVQANIRHGFIPAGSIVPSPDIPVQSDVASFLLDMDLFVEAPQPLDVDALAEQLDILHSQIDRFFRWTLAPQGETHFGVEDLG